MEINKVLIANRGEIARRIAKTCRAMGIMTVAVCSDPDLESPIAREADEVIRLPGTTSVETYLNGDKILEAAADSGAEAVHPGYGFLAENADFARACSTRGVIFIGPPPEVIESMASKLGSKAIVEAAGVPILPAIDVTQLDGDALLEAAHSVGWPLLVKASAGGGGRGIRVVTDPVQLPDAVAGAAREAAAAFDDATLLIERFVQGSRHVEVQVFGDRFGNVTHLFERECSIQRRFQKLVEESPAPGLLPETLDGLRKTATLAAQAVGYVGAGTVEMLVAPDGDFFFLEMNTRLQVEHPVTEAVTALDLVRLQILVAEGRPLPEHVLEARQQGHAIEVRLYAEDPARGYAPVTGRVSRFEVLDRPGLRVDAAVENGSDVTPFYDALLAKLIAWAPSRPEAVRLLLAALREARIHGITTNRELLIAVLEDPCFQEGAFHTGFLDDFDPSPSPAARQRELLHAAAAAVASALRRAAATPVNGAIAPGWRVMPPTRTRARLKGRNDLLDVAYCLSGERLVTVGEAKASVVSADENEVVLEIDGIRRRFEIEYDDMNIFVDSPMGSDHFQDEPRFRPPSSSEDPVDGSVSAPMHGIIVRVLVDVGTSVERGTPLAVMEAMKMEQTISSPTSGIVIELLVAEGQQVEGGASLVVIESHESGT